MPCTRFQADGDLNGIDVLDEEVSWLASVGKELRVKAEIMLKQGMQSLSQAEVGTVLQVYYNLDELHGAVRDVQARYIQVLSSQLTLALDPAKISAVSAAAAGGGAGVGLGAAPGAAHRLGGPQAGGAQRWQQALWQQLSSCMDALHTPIIAMWHLQV